MFFQPLRFLRRNSVENSVTAGPSISNTLSSKDVSLVMILLSVVYYLPILRNTESMTSFDDKVLLIEGTKVIYLFRIEFLKSITKR